MADVIPPSRQALAEALALSAEILKNLELSELSLANIALKVSRLARLLNDFDAQKMMEYEVSGYPMTPGGVPQHIYQLAVVAGREIQTLDSKTGKTQASVHCHSIGELEETVRLADASLAAAHSPAVSTASTHPDYSSIGDRNERESIRASTALASKRLSSRRAMIHQYTLRKHYELKFSGIADDVFTRIRERVDETIGQTVPDAVQKLSAVYDNLRSENPEDWSNAVHSCRRILQDLADAVFPPTDTERSKVVDGKTIKIKLGKDNFINRVLAFVEDTSSSQRFKDIVGSHIAFLGDRLDSVFQAGQKGSHTTIVSREEAERYVVYTYLLVGDILSLREQ